MPNSETPYKRPPLLWDCLCLIFEGGLKRGAPLSCGLLMYSNVQAHLKRVYVPVWWCWRWQSTKLCQCIDAQWCSDAVGRSCCTCVVTLQVASCVSVLMHSGVHMQWGETVVPVWWYYRWLVVSDSVYWHTVMFRCSGETLFYLCGDVTGGRVHGGQAVHETRPGHQQRLLAPYVSSTWLQYYPEGIATFLYG